MCNASATEHVLANGALGVSVKFAWMGLCVTSVRFPVMCGVDIIVYIVLLYSLGGYMTGTVATYYILYIAYVTASVFVCLWIGLENI